MTAHGTGGALGPGVPQRPADLPVPPGLGLGPDLLDRARRLARGELAPAPTRDAATVVLLRDGVDGVEAYVIRRVRTMAFAAGMYVFPGGSVDPRDEDTTTAWAGPAAAEWTAPLSATEPLARALVCAAVRETFEESGVLLAGPAPDRVVEDTADYEQDRTALLDRSLSLAGMLHQRGLVLRADLLRPWAHWVTPEVEPRRYDTRFFVAALPAGQRTRDVGGEADRVVWARPRDLLDAVRAGDVTMLPPTIFTLGELTAFGTVQQVLDAGARRDVRRVLPRVVVDDADAAALLLPGDDGYGG